MLTLPSAFRGTPAVGYFTHCAAKGTDTRSKTTRGNRMGRRIHQDMRSVTSWRVTRSNNRTHPGFILRGDMETLSTPDVSNEHIPEFEAIFREHYRLTYRTAYAITGSAEDAEDVAQTIFMRLLRRGSPPDLKRSPGAYFYRAAVNLSLNAIRGRKRQSLALDRARLEVRPGIEESDSAEEIHRRLYDAVAQLDPSDAHMLILRYAHNYSDAEIAKLLGVARTTTAVRLYRARARLRKLMRAASGDKP